MSEAASAQPLADVTGSTIAWKRDWDAAFAHARRERRLVLIDVEKDH
jgi:hypothetical protein